VAKAEGPLLRVTSQPRGAEIILNGKPVGRTPKTLRGLDASRNYFVVLRKDGYKKYLKGVKFGGKNKLVVKAALEATGSAKAPAAKPPPKPEPKAATKGGKGFLVANTRPWAKVIIDGRDTGKWTPVVGKNKIALPAGKHVVTFRTKEGKTHAVRVTIRAGKTTKVIEKIE